MKIKAILHRMGGAVGTAQEKPMFSMQNTRTIKIPRTVETNNKQHQRGCVGGGKFTKFMLRSSLRFPLHVRTHMGIWVRRPYVIGTCAINAFFPFLASSFFFSLAAPRFRAIVCIQGFRRGEITKITHVVTK